MHPLFARTNVFIQQLWAFDTYEVEPTLFCHSGGKECLPAPRIPVQKEAEIYNPSGQNQNRTTNKTLRTQSGAATAIV